MKIVDNQEKSMKIEESIKTEVIQNRTFSLFALFDFDFLRLPNFFIAFNKCHNIWELLIMKFMILSTSQFQLPHLFN